MGAGGARKRGEVINGSRCADRLESKTERGRRSDRRIARFRWGFSRVAASSLKGGSKYKKGTRHPETHDEMRAPNARPRPEGMGLFPPTRSLTRDGPAG